MATTHLPARDPVTGAIAQADFALALAAQWARAVQRGQRLAVWLAGADRFATANERWGRQIANDLLAAIARRIGGILPIEGILGRHHGDQLAAACVVTSPDDAAAFAARMRTRVADRPFPVLEAHDAFFFTISVGVAISPERTHVLPGDLMKVAEAALRQAKQSGRNRIVAMLAQGRAAAPRAEGDE